MRTADAPPPGWYPDPQGGVRLRWWDGTDWVDRYRARPNSGEHVIAGAVATRVELARQVRGQTGVPSSAQTAEIVAQVRQAARAEVDRAADLFSARARDATRQIEPLISQYTSRLLRWLKLAAMVAFVLVVAWFVFQAVVQVSFFEWLGDRIDNVTDDAAGVPH